MSSLMTMIYYEYKKIITKKIFIAALLLMVFVSTFCMIGHLINDSRADENSPMVYYSTSTTKENAEIIKTVTGYLTDEKVNDLIVKNAKARSMMSDEGSYPVEVFRENVEPYSPLLASLVRILSPVSNIDSDNLNSLKNGAGVDFYRLRDKSLEDYMAYEKYDPKEISDIMGRNNRLSTPFYYDYFEGYRNFFTMMSASAVFIIIGAAICIAPVFSGEYGRKTDALILSSKNGKGKLITAKIITASSFSLLFTLMGFILAIATNFGVYSFTGGETSWQILKLYSVYPLNMLQAFLIYCGVSLLAALAVSGLVSLLSAYTSSFVTITISSAVIFFTMLFNIPGIKELNYLLPSKMVNWSFVFSDRPVNLLGFFIEPYVFIPIVAIALTAVSFPLCRRGFRRHQVS